MKWMQLTTVFFIISKQVLDHTNISSWDYADYISIIYFKWILQSRYGVKSLFLVKISTDNITYLGGGMFLFNPAAPLCRKCTGPGHLHSVWAWWYTRLSVWWLRFVQSGSCYTGSHRTKCKNNKDNITRMLYYV